MKVIKLIDGVEFEGKAIKKPIPIDYLQINEPFQVETLEHANTFTAKAGDYLIRGINGEYYACDKEIFEKSYDKQKVHEDFL